MLNIEFNGIWWCLGCLSLAASISYLWDRKKINEYHKNFLFWYPDFKGKESLVKVLRIFTIPSLILGAILFYDFVIPSTENDIAIVYSKGKAVWRGLFYINARGEKYTYYELLDNDNIYKNIEFNDKLDIKVSKFIKKLKTATVYRGNDRLFSFSGYDLIGMLLFSLGLISTVVIFCNYRDIAPYPLFIIIGILGISSVHILSNLIVSYMQLWASK